MGAERKPKRAGNTWVTKRSAVKLTPLRALRAAPRQSGGAGIRLGDHMPNGDPPALMLWGNEG